MNQKPSSLFSAWGAYVFLPINIVVGTIILESGASIEELLISLIIALIIMMGLAFPAVCLSSKYSSNYAQSVIRFVKSNFLVKVLILLIPIVNIGWYAIQTVMFVDIINNYSDLSSSAYAILILLMSYIFAIGVTKYEYLWLKNIGLIGMLIMVIMLLFNLEIGENIIYGFVREENIYKYIIEILGTWVFSSVTCIMDITAHVYDAKRGFKYIVMATFLTNTLLIVLGYLMAVSIEVFTAMSILNLVAILVAIWTTNDSNFYSTLCSLEVLGLTKKKIFIFIPLISSLVAIFWIKDFESFIVKWLSVMSWIGIPIGIMWWIVYIKEKGARKNDNCS